MVSVEGPYTKIPGYARQLRRTVYKRYIYKKNNNCWDGKNVKTCSGLYTCKCTVRPVIDTAHRIVFAAGSIVTLRCPSVCHSMGPQQQTPCYRFAAVSPAGRRYRSTAARPVLSSSSGWRMRAVVCCQRT